GQLITRQVNLVGIDAETYDTVSDFGKYLLHPENREQVDFELREAGYAPDREDFPDSGWEYRRARAAYEKAIEAERLRIEAIMAESRRASGQPLAAPDAAAMGPGWSPLQATPEFASESGNPVEFDPAKETFPGIVLGIATCSTRVRGEGEEASDYF